MNRLCRLLASSAVGLALASIAVPARSQPQPAPPPDPTSGPPQRDPAPAPEPVSPPEPEPVPQPPQATPEPAPPPSTSPPPQPPQATPEPGAPPAATPPPPPPAQRFEGQVEPGDGTGYAEDFGDGQDYSAGAAEPESEVPPFSIRIDPLNWLLEGRLGFELEVAVWEFITVELTPAFIVNDDPPLTNYGTFDDVITIHSDGIGPLAGASLGVGFWLNGTPFHGYVVRVLLTNYDYLFQASDSRGVFDKVERTERHFVAFIGSQSSWGLFTIGGGLGLGYDLLQAERCGLEPNDDGGFSPVESGCDEMQIAVSRTPVMVGSAERAIADDLNGFVHPFYIEGRFSLGLLFD